MMKQRAWSGSPLSLSSFPAKLPGSGGRMGNSLQLLQAGGSPESLRKVATTNITDTVPLQSGKAGNRPRDF